MDLPKSLLLRSRIVLPLTGEPIENGAVRISGARITQVDGWAALQAGAAEEVVDLGESILMPGLINAHCHLDYTGMAGQITPTHSFSDWIKALLALKAHCTYSDFAAAWLRGARMLLEHGVTTVADIEAVPELLPEVRAATPLRVCSLLEMTGVRSRRSAGQILQEATEWIEKLSRLAGWGGLSPHAPYSTGRELLRLSAAAARQRHWLLATHVAESQEEFAMFAHAAGPMYEWLKSQRDMSDCGLGSPVEHLERQGLLGTNLLAIHVNYLGAGDARRLGRSGSHVVHCPRSHAYFGFQPFPRAQLAEEGVNICLGTDSLASVRSGRNQKLELDLLAEMRTLAQNAPEYSPVELLGLATRNGAKALGQSGKLGELSEGALADVVALPYAGRIEEAYAAVVGHSGPVSAVLINGQWAFDPQGLHSDAAC